MIFIKHFMTRPIYFLLRFPKQEIDWENVVITQNHHLREVMNTGELQKGGDAVTETHQ